MGAGAAGLATAIFLKTLQPSRPVILLEGAARPGAKILVSGGSRCNVTNAAVSERDFWGGSRAVIRQVLRRLPVADTVRFFETLGVTLHEEAHGKLFPDTNRSRDVLDALLRAIQRADVSLRPSVRVTGLSASADGWRLATSVGVLDAGTVILATGGQSLPKSGSDGMGYAVARTLGHTIVPTTPALVPLVLASGRTALHETLKGVSHRASLTLSIGGPPSCAPRTSARLRGSPQAIHVTGDLLWTHFGISGPAALDMSRHWLRATLGQTAPQLTLNVLPGERFETIEAALVETARASPRATLASTLSSRLPASVAAALLGRLDLAASQQMAQLSRDDRRTVAHALVGWPLDVVDSRGYTYAEATAGGVALDEVRASTLESRLHPRLYFVGEILDVDGRLGGFNFQWAWSSARTVALAVARQDRRNSQLHNAQLPS